MNILDEHGPNVKRPNDWLDYLDAQHEILQGILDGMPRDEREAYFREQGLTSDGLPLDVELVEAADLLATIDGRAGA